MKGILTFAAAALLSTAAFAQTPPAGQTSPSGGSSVFDQFDSDHDGNVSQSEAQVNSTVMANFNQADTDHDGKLSKSEFDAAFKPSNEPMTQPQSEQSSTPSDRVPANRDSTTPPSDMPSTTDMPSTSPSPSTQPPEEAPPSTQPPQK